MECNYDNLGFLDGFWFMMGKAAADVAIVIGFFALIAACIFGWVLAMIFKDWITGFFKNETTD